MGVLRATRFLRRGMCNTCAVGVAELQEYLVVSGENGMAALGTTE